MTLVRVSQKFQTEAYLDRIVADGEEIWDFLEHCPLPFLVCFRPQEPLLVVFF